MPEFTWARRHPNGYEVSSKGDKRFSAFTARLPDGRTIEEHYQCDIKGYDPGGTNWRLGKGKPPITPFVGEELFLAYKNLWRQWIGNNLPTVIMLCQCLIETNKTVLTDCFASTPINQARALAEILNELQVEYM